MAKRLWQPKKHKRMKKHGFLHRMASLAGQALLKRRRQKGRTLLSVVRAGK